MARRPARLQKRSSTTTRRRPAAKKAARSRQPKRSSGKGAAARKAGRRPAAKAAAPTAKAAVRKKIASKPATAGSRAIKGARRTPKPAASPSLLPRKAPRLDRARRTLEETTPSLPSSLDLDRHPSAARSGRAELAESRRHHAAMTPGITAGDPDADVENAYFSGEEAPGGDNSTPDQDVVDEIGRALGLEYQDNEELRPQDKLADRDKHRWELDPASSDDYKERD